MDRVDTSVNLKSRTVSEEQEKVVVSNRDGIWKNRESRHLELG